MPCCPIVWSLNIFLLKYFFFQVYPPGIFLTSITLTASFFVFYNPQVLTLSHTSRKIFYKIITSCGSFNVVLFCGKKTCDINLLCLIVFKKPQRQDISFLLLFFPFKLNVASCITIINITTILWCEGAVI